jgi:hypothetical protein
VRSLRLGTDVSMSSWHDGTSYRCERARFVEGIRGRPGILQQCSGLIGALPSRRAR